MPATHSIRPEISIVIVNFRSANFTRKCLQSIDAGGARPAVEIFVVDNNSDDGCGQMIRREFRDVTFIQSGRNLGFAGANNLGAARAKGEFLLFLNPDTEIQGTAIQGLLRALRSDLDAAMAGAMLLNSDLSLQTTSITAFPSILNQILGTDSLRRRCPKASLWGMRPLFEKHVAPVAVDAISGACMLIRKSVFNAVRGFTPDYFMYAEDLDLCLKVHQAGWKVLYVPGATIVHHGGQSSSSRQESNYAAVMIRESMAKFMKIHRGRAYAMAFRGATGFSAAARLTLLCALAPVAFLRRRSAALRRGLSKWAGILGWSLGLQTWIERDKCATESSSPIARAA